MAKKGIAVFLGVLGLAALPALAGGPLTVSLTSPSGGQTLSPNQLPLSVDAQGSLSSTAGNPVDLILLIDGSQADSASVALRGGGNVKSAVFSFSASLGSYGSHTLQVCATQSGSQGNSRKSACSDVVVLTVEPACGWSDNIVWGGGYSPSGPTCFDFGSKPDIVEPGSGSDNIVWGE